MSIRAPGKLPVNPSTAVAPALMRTLAAGLIARLLAQPGPSASPSSLRSFLGLQARPELGPPPVTGAYFAAAVLALVRAYATFAAQARSRVWYVDRLIYRRFYTEILSHGHADTHFRCRARPSSLNQPTRRCFAFNERRQHRSLVTSPTRTRKRTDESRHGSGANVEAAFSLNVRPEENVIWSPNSRL